MQHETVRLDCAEIFAELQKLCERSRQLCAASRALCAEAQQIKSPWPHPIGSQAPDSQQDAAPLDTPPSDPHEIAMDALRLIRTIIDPFPLEWQVAIVKALTARTIVQAYDRTRPAPAVLSA